MCLPDGSHAGIAVSCTDYAPQPVAAATYSPGTAIPLLDLDGLRQLAHFVTTLHLPAASSIVQTGGVLANKYIRTSIAGRNPRESREHHAKESGAKRRHTRIAHGRILPLLGRREAHPNVAVCKPSMHAYALRCMIIRWREWSSRRYSDRSPARARAPMSLTQLSLVPHAGEVANAC